MLASNQTFGRWKSLDPKNAVFPNVFVFFYAKLYTNGSRWKGVEIVKKCPGQESKELIL